MGTLDVIKVSSEDVEKKMLSYLLNGNKEHISKIQPHFFQTKECQVIFKEIPNATFNEQIDIDILLEKVNLLIPFNKEKLLAIKSFSTSFDNIVETIELAKSHYFSNKSIDCLEKLYEDISSRKGKVDFPTVQKTIDEISQSLTYINSDRYLLGGSEVSDLYKEVMDERAKGIAKRSYGFPEIDNVMVRPAAPGEFTLIVGNSGAGKSMLAYNMLNAIANQKIPVVYFNLEMEMDAVLDRRVAIRRGINVGDLMHQKKSEDLKQVIEQELDQMRRDKYMMYVSHPSISLNVYDRVLSQAKVIFREKGVLPEDEYMVVGIDLFTMFTDFSVMKQWNDLDSILNKFHAINRKHRCHALPLVQANENKIRGGKGFKRLSDLDFYQVNFEDIKGGGAFKERARVVFSLNRPKQMKERYFPELKDEYEADEDILKVGIIKSSQDRSVNFIDFVLGDNFKIIPKRG